LDASYFIAKEYNNFISGKKSDKDLPALKELVEKLSIVNIFDTVYRLWENMRPWQEM